MDRYTPEKGVHDPDEDFDIADENSFEVDDWFVVEKKPTMFHIGQSYEQEPAKKLSCRKCGSEDFNVGKGNYFTAIRCSKCHWEQCVHEG